MFSFFKSLGDGEADVARLFLDFTTGATGAVPARSTWALKKGIESATRNSAGNYTFVLTTRWNRFVGLDCTVVNATYTAATKGLNCRVVSETVNASTRAITVQFVTEAGAAADVDDNARLIFTFKLKRGAL